MRGDACTFACLHVWEPRCIGSCARRRGDATQTGVAPYTAIGGARVQCLAHGSHPPARPREVYLVLEGGGPVVLVGAARSSLRASDCLAVRPGGS